MTVTNKTSKRNLTSDEKVAFSVVKKQTTSDIDRISEALNEDGIIIDNRDPSFNSSMVMNHWSHECEAYLKWGDEESKKRKVYYKGGTLITGWSKKLNNYCLYNSKIYTLEEEAVEYMESIIS